MVAALGPGEPHDVEIILLEKNLESVLRALQSGKHLGISRERFADAIDRKKLRSRDEIFEEAAKDANRAARDHVLAQIPSVERLVARAFERLTRVMDATRAPPAQKR